MADRSFGDDLKSTAKSRAVRGITGSLFGSGVVGTALKRTLQRKFAEKDVDQEDKVVDALKEQEEVITDNDKTLIRIERIVMNIADNIYNIAGIMNAQVVSMREAERLRQQARSRDVASREEAAFEATREVAPTAAGTEVTKPEEGKKGIVASLIGTVGKTKRMFGAFLKKFGVAALAVTGTLAAATAAIAAARSSSSNEEGDGEDDEVDVESGEGAPTTPPAVNINDGSYDTAEAARLSRNASTPPPPPPPQASPVQKDDMAGQMMSQFSQMTSQVPGGAVANQRLAPFMSAMQSDNPIASFIAAAQDDAARNPQPKPSPPPPPPPPPQPEPTVVSQPAASAGTAPTKSTADLIETTKGYIQANNKRLGQRESAYEERVARIRKKYADKPEAMQQMLKDEAFGIEDYRRMVNESNAMLENRIKQLEQEGAQAPSTSGVSSGSVSAPAGGGAGMGGGSVSAGAAGGSSGGGSSTPVLPSPSTGADIGSSSVQLAADMRTPSGTSTSPQVMTAESATSSVGGQSPSVIPSPVADRGSLDKNITFDSAMN